MSDRWQGAVQVSMTDLGGNLDLVSVFRPSEQLLLDLYDAPDDVKRLAWESHDLWWRYFEELNEIIQPTNPGYTSWAPILSADPSYMLQCDFCYMIGPDMFDEFVRPELVKTCGKLQKAFYHLDGPGQIPHLGSMLSMENLNGIQWIPGAGEKSATQWPELYKSVLDAGKLVQLYGAADYDPLLRLDWIDTFAEQQGSAKGAIILGCTAPIERKDEVMKFLSKWGIEE